MLTILRFTSYSLPEFIVFVSESKKAAQRKVTEIITDLIACERIVFDDLHSDTWQVCHTSDADTAHILFSDERCGMDWFAAVNGQEVITNGFQTPPAGLYLRKRLVGVSPTEVPGSLAIELQPGDILRVWWSEHIWGADIFDSTFGEPFIECPAEQAP